MKIFLRDEWITDKIIKINFMSTYTTTGIILSNRDFREADKIFSIYTSSHGKVEALACGVRKIKSKLRAHLEPFSVIDLMIAHGRRHDRLIGAIQQKSYFRFKGNYPSQRLVSHWLKLSIINYQFLEIVDQLTKLHHSDVRIFNLIKEIFDYLELNDNINSEFINSYFRIRLLSYLGYTPELRICVRCKTEVKKNPHFSFHDGSIICEKCVTTDQSISPESIEILQNYLIHNLQDCCELSNNESLKISQNFLNYHLDRPLKSLTLIK